ncbi:MAG: hypothetical protein U0528_06290 [Anaerolineae bacterium]
MISERAGVVIMPICAFTFMLLTPLVNSWNPADGGAVDWTQKLLSNAKERCVIGGIGSERVCLEFTPIQQ